MSTQLIFEFTEDSDLSDWYILDDGVMGGRSDGNFIISDEGFGMFYGKVSLENNGGFSSVRYSCGELNLKGKSGFKLRIKGDGKNYQFRVKENRNDYHSFVCTVSTTGEWETIEIPLEDMYASWRGRKVNIPNLSDSQIEELGILIGNKKAESFKLIIDKIEVY